MTPDHSTNTRPNAPASTDADQGVLLTGLDGANPVGFLASLGVLHTLAAAKPGAKIEMSWSNGSGAWNPVIHGIPERTSSIGSTIANYLKCPFQPEADADAIRNVAQKKFDVTKTKLKKAQESLKRRGLRGTERATAEEETVEPVRKELETRREEWLVALRKCVPSLELSLGKQLNITADQFRHAALDALDAATRTQHEVVDLLASFGSDVCLVKKTKIESTPFCFTTGSGRQYFLDTVRQLYGVVDSSRIEATLFQHAEHRDEKLSMRWDPIEDRRYALMWEDPTAPGNEPRTNWAMNLLAYRGLQLLPSVPTSRGLKSTGWLSDERGIYWTWPIWNGAASLRVIRSLLSHSLLATPSVNFQTLAAMGIAAVYRAFRIQVGGQRNYKINFTPAQRIA